jgi:hypothetical protein
LVACFGLARLALQSNSSVLVEQAPMFPWDDRTARISPEHNNCQNTWTVIASECTGYLSLEHIHRFSSRAKRIEGRMLDRRHGIRGAHCN